MWTERVRAILHALLLGLLANCTTTLKGELRWHDARVADTIDGATSPQDAQVDAIATRDGAQVDASVDGDAPRLAVQLDNLRDGQTLNHPLARIVGRVDPLLSAIDVSAGSEPSMRWPVRDGFFKALVRLAKGPNKLHLDADGKTTSLTLSYEPQTNPHRVRFVYVMAADGDGTFQAPPAEPSSTASAIARLELAADMLQTFTAESMQRQNGVRRTFNVVRDSSGRADILLHKSNLTRAQALGMSGGDLWGAINSELSNQPDADETIHVAVMAFTRYDPSTKTVGGHTALGGGRLALFGSSSLHTWPENLAQVPERTQDTSVIDGTSLFDDSAGRKRAWANYATGLGATLHELGHCLGVYHTQPSETYMMSRGFDHILRWFSVTEPPSATSGGLSHVTEQDEPRWYPGNAAWLLFQRYLDGVSINYANNTPPVFDINSTRVRISSVNKLRVLLFIVEGEVRDYLHFENGPPQSTELLLQPYRNLYGSGSSFNVVALDDWGNSADSGVYKL